MTGMTRPHPHASTARDVAGAARARRSSRSRRENGIDIPTLCHLDGLSDVGACRLCLVEVAGVAQAAAACITARRRGHGGHDRTPSGSPSYRRMIVELLFAERNHVCSVCVANGHCELQDLADELGVDHVRLPAISTRAAGVDASHPRFAIDHNRCILCTRCVRVCDEIEGAHTWDVMGRGIDARVDHRPGHSPGASRRPAPAAASASRSARPAPCSRRADRSPRWQQGPPPFLPYLDARRGRRHADDASRRLATVWLDGCSGCHMSFLDLDERLLELAERVDLVFSPLVDVKEYPEDVDVMPRRRRRVASEDDLHKIRMRPRADHGSLVSFGDCAVTGNVPGDAQPDRRRSRCSRRAYLENVDAQRRRSRREVVPALLPTARPVHAVVDGRRLPAGLPAVGRPHLRRRSIDLLDGRTARHAAAPGSAAEDDAP